MTESPLYLGHQFGQIIQILRRSTRPVTAAALAEELEVSKRTVYRDVADLIGQRVPVEGEAGLEPVSKVVKEGMIHRVICTGG
jgi:predicted DNA-binding transcriptional regulator YafY